MANMVNSRKLTDLHPHMMNLCKQHITNCAKRGVYIVVCDVMRSDSYQAYLYEQGRSRDGNIVTWTKTTYAHGMYEYKGEYKSMAYDVAPLTDDKKNTDYGNRAKWKVIIEEGKKLGLEHGTEVFGKADDPHWQLVEGLTKTQLKNGKRPSYWNKEITKPIKPTQTKYPTQILFDKRIISTLEWNDWLNKEQYIQSEYMKSLIINFYLFFSGEKDFFKAMSFIADKKLISDKTWWLDKLSRPQEIESKWCKILVDRMSCFIESKSKGC